MQSRLTIIKFACAITVLFIGGMIFLQGCQEDRPDLSSHYFPEMSIKERQHFSPYNWNNLNEVKLVLESDESGMASIRAVNGEIICQVYLERGIEADIQIDVPKELDRLMIDYKNNTEDVSLGAKRIALEF